MLAFESALPTLLARYNGADAGTVDRGRRWYDAARKECRSIARDSGYSFKQVAAVLAITSPDAQLSTNIRWTREACANHGATAGRYPTAQLPKIRAALGNRRDPGRYVTGPKVSAFYAAIVGETDSLVIDRWASFAAGGPRDVPAAKDRRAIHAAYLAAAELTGETVRDFQAIVWIACRESTPVDHVGRGTLLVRKLADIV